jgi:hypothetical protein
MGDSVKRSLVERGKEDREEEAEESVKENLFIYGTFDGPR